MLTQDEGRELARSLLPHASLAEVRLFHVAVDHLSFPDDPNRVGIGQLSVRMEAVETGSEYTTGAYILHIETDLRSDPVEGESLEDEDDDRAILLKISARYGAFYFFSGIDSVTEDQHQAFACFVAHMTLWPFVRTLIANLASDAGYPKVLLPIVLNDVAASGFYTPPTE